MKYILFLFLFISCNFEKDNKSPEIKNIQYVIEKSLQDEEFSGIFLNNCDKLVILMYEDGTFDYKSEVGICKYLNSILITYPVSSYTISIECDETGYFTHYNTEILSKNYITSDTTKYSISFETYYEKIIKIKIN